MARYLLIHAKSGREWGPGYGPKAFTFSSVRRLADGYNVTDDTARQ